MTTSPEKQGRKDFYNGRTTPPATYYSQEYRDAWQRGHDEAKAEHDKEQDAKNAYEDQWRYLPASYRAMHELQEAVGQDTADKIKALVEAMIQEAAE